MNTLLNNLTEEDLKKSFITVYKDGAEFQIKLSDFLNALNLTNPTATTSTATKTPLLPMVIGAQQGYIIVDQTPILKQTIVINGTNYNILMTP